MKTPTVFISYSHDSPEHTDRVLAFANWLREDGIDCTLDQYETSPPEGWPKWMDRHIAKSDFVIVICTETYYRRVMGEEEPGKGRVIDRFRQGGFIEIEIGTPEVAPSGAISGFYWADGEGGGHSAATACGSTRVTISIMMVFSSKSLGV